MRFACLTLSFNQGSYLSHAIDSILSQNESIDYLVYDPGSSDESRKIIESYMDRGVRKHFVDGDSGPADGLNQGLKLLTGEIFY
jgi:glycosyltransferase involved in cell wall biosynthesis